MPGKLGLYQKGQVLTRGRWEKVTQNVEPQRGAMRSPGVKPRGLTGGGLGGPAVSQPGVPPWANASRPVGLKTARASAFFPLAIPKQGSLIEAPTVLEHFPALHQGAPAPSRER